MAIVGLSWSGLDRLPAQRLASSAQIAHPEVWRKHGKVTRSSLPMIGLSTLGVVGGLRVILPLLLLVVAACSPGRADRPPSDRALVFLRETDRTLQVLGSPSIRDRTLTVRVAYNRLCSEPNRLHVLERRTWIGYLPVGRSWPSRPKDCVGTPDRTVMEARLKKPLGDRELIELQGRPEPGSPIRPSDRRS